MPLGQFAYIGKIDFPIFVILCYSVKSFFIAEMEFQLRLMIF